MNTEKRTIPDFDEFLGLTYGQMMDKLAEEVPDK
jgi:hypothetical protein